MSVGIISQQMWELIVRQRLSFIATVGPDAKPNLCPISTLAVWDSDHLIFANIHAPRTVANLRTNPAIEVNVVDPMARKGGRFTGTGKILTEGSLFDHAVWHYQHRGVKSQIISVVIVKVERVSELKSPAYDFCPDEEQIKAKWTRYWAAKQLGNLPDPTGE